jgi:hypothetical protein
MNYNPPLVPQAFCGWITCRNVELKRNKRALTSDNSGNGVITARSASSNQSVELVQHSRKDEHKCIATDVDEGDVGIGVEWLAVSETADCAERNGLTESADWQTSTTSDSKSNDAITANTLTVLVGKYWS